MTEFRRHAKPAANARTATPTPVWLRRTICAGVFLAIVAAYPPAAVAQPPASAPAPLRAAADQFRSVIDAVQREHRETGVWPRTLDDMLAAGDAELRKRISYEWRVNAEPLLHVTLTDAERRVASAREMVFVFGGLDEGWYLQTSHGAYEPLDFEPFDLPRPSDALAQNVDHIAHALRQRVAAKPSDPVPHAMLVTALSNADRRQEARDAALEWVRACPHDLKAGWALYETERKLRSGLNRYESSGPWRNREYGTFAAWALVHAPFNDSSDFEQLAAALQLPAADGETEWYVAEVSYCDIADGLGNFDDWRLLITVCDLWQAAAEKRSEFKSSDRSYLAFRANAHLALGKIEQARTDAEAAAEAERQGLLWVGSTRELLAAIRERNGPLKFYAPRLHEDQKWQITPR